MIPESVTPKELKRNFLTDNPKYQEIEDTKSALADFFSIDDDDEIWVMQCPRETNISLLKDQKIKLPGRSTQNELEAVAIAFPEPIPHAFGYKNKKGHNSVKILPVEGSIVLRSRLNAVQLPVPDDAASITSTNSVPMPTGIKERHPLHGVDFERKLKIAPQVAERLNKVNEMIQTKPRKSKKKSKHKSKEASTIALDSDGDVELVIQKKHKKKKKKRKHSNDDEREQVPIKREKKTSQSEDIAKDLQWIQNL